MAHTQQALTHKGYRHFSRFQVLEQRVCCAEKTGVVIFWNNVIYFRFVLEKTKQFWPIQTSSLEKIDTSKMLFTLDVILLSLFSCKISHSCHWISFFLFFSFFSVSALLMWRRIRCRNIGNLMKDPKETVCPAHQLVSVVTRVHCHYVIVLILLYWQLKLHCWPDFFLSGVKVFLMVFFFFIID